MRVAFDCDDAGLPLKQVILEQLQDLGVDAVDLNLLAQRRVDYPDIGHNLAKRVAAKEFERGVLVCGTGLGMAMVANKVQGVFAGTCHDVYSAERLSKSNDAHVLTLTHLDVYKRQDLEQVRRIPQVVGVVAGADRSEAIAAAIRGGLLNAVVMDDSAAQFLSTAVQPRASSRRKPRGAL